MTRVLEVHDLEKNFGGVVAAHNITVNVDEGETIGIIGANGAGKTTFVNMVTGYLPPSAGTIEFLGQNVVGMRPREVTKLGLCRSFQVPQVFLSETVFDNMLVAYGIAERSGWGLLTPLHTEDREQRVDAHLRRYQISDYRDTAAAALPQGVRKLLDIAMATVRNPKLIMLDEPTSGISVEEKFGLMDIIMQALREEETTVMFIEHDMEIVFSVADYITVLVSGAVLTEGEPEVIAADERVRAVYLGEVDRG